MRKKMSLRNILGICVCAVACSFSGRTAHGVALVACLFSGRAGNLSLLPYAFFFVIAGLLFLLFQNKFSADSEKEEQPQ